MKSNLLRKLWKEKVKELKKRKENRDEVKGKNGKLDKKRGIERYEENVKCFA